MKLIHWIIYVIVFGLLIIVAKIFKEAEWSLWILIGWFALGCVICLVGFVVGIINVIKEIKGE